MEFITKAQLSKSRSVFESTNYVSLSSAINDSQTRNSRYGEATVFLSHKHSDLEEFRNAIALLKNLKVNIYVDWMDKDMPKETSGVTAQIIKQKIKENKKFILLATQNAIDSKWCNWELGLGDAEKYIKDIALLVVAENNGAWSGNEYMQIYPIIGRKYSWSDSAFEVKFPNGRMVDLQDWLAN